MNLNLNLCPFCASAACHPQHPNAHRCRPQPKRHQPEFSYYLLDQRGRFIGCCAVRRLKFCVVCVGGSVGVHRWRRWRRKIRTLAQLNRPALASTKLQIKPGTPKGLRQPPQTGRERSRRFRPVLTVAQSLSQGCAFLFFVARTCDRIQNRRFFADRIKKKEKP